LYMDGRAAGLHMLTPSANKPGKQEQKPAKKHRKPCQVLK